MSRASRGEENRHGRAAPARLACVVVPLFPLAARIRSEPELAREAAAVLEGNGNAARIVAATRSARQVGVRAGLTLPQARTLVPGLVTRGRDPVTERAAQEALLEAAESLSPRVEDAGDGVAYVDFCGLQRLQSSNDLDADTELAIAQALVAAAGRERLPARVGVASSKLAARVAAALSGSPTRVAPGEEAAFLAPLPLARLSPELETAATLARWGISTIGELARLAPGDVASRLGDAGYALHQTARGADPHPFVPRHPPPELTEGMQLEWPLVTLEPFLAMAESALERLTRRLAMQGLGCARLDVALDLDPDGTVARSITLPAPTRDTKTLLTLVRLDVEQNPPGAPVVGFAFSAAPDRPRAGQLSLFGPAEVSPDRLAAVLAKLFAMLGEDRVGAPGAVDGRRPERFALQPYAPPPPPLFRGAARGGRGLLAVRVLRPPLEMELRHDEKSGEMRSLKTLPGLTPGIAGNVRVASGPWTLEEGWWSEEPVARDYWDVELADGGLYRVFRDRATERWFLDGVYD
ncbi:MAG TPA: DNA polymerase Y family protein [Thermoanaerobaculia bacterium]|nr:DNA polymerase Y family protein [Thermoanaerobaculia bacterium]